MPFEIDLGNPPPIGYLITSARAGEEVQVCIREFTSTEDGQHFIHLLEALPTQILLKLPSPFNPSQIDHMLAIIRSNGKTSVYVNELEFHVHFRQAGVMEPGSLVTKDDIADVERLDPGKEIPDDAGVLLVFSHGWRKGLFFDFEPISRDNPVRRQYDITTQLGQSLCHLLFQEIFNISDAEWTSLFDTKWFPFILLRKETINSLLGQIRSGWDPDELLDDICCEIREYLAQTVDVWRSVPAFLPHLKILERAVERFKDDDHISCTGLLYPRIEGILRDHQVSLQSGFSPSSSNLAKSAVSAKTDKSRCLLLPLRFSAYLKDVYFAHFNPNDPEIDVSRHSVSHGVASESRFDLKSAVIAILTVHQLAHFLKN